MKARLDVVDGRVRLARALSLRGVVLGLALGVVCGAMLALAGGGAAAGAALALGLRMRLTGRRWRSGGRIMRRRCGRMMAG